MNKYIIMGMKTNKGWDATTLAKIINFLIGSL